MKNQTNYPRSLPELRKMLDEAGFQWVSIVNPDDDRANGIEPAPYVVLWYSIPATSTEQKDKLDYWLSTRTGGKWRYRWELGASDVGELHMEEMTIPLYDRTSICMICGLPILPGLLATVTGVDGFMMAIHMSHIPPIDKKLIRKREVAHKILAAVQAIHDGRSIRITSQNDLELEIDGYSYFLKIMEPAQYFTSLPKE